MLTRAKLLQTHQEDTGLFILNLRSKLLFKGIAADFVVSVSCPVSIFSLSFKPGVSNVEQSALKHYLSLVGSVLAVVVLCFHYRATDFLQDFQYKSSII